MFKNLILLFLLGHILGDFYFQTSRMAERKMKEIKVLILHGALYLLSCVLVILRFFSLPLLCASVLLGFSHFGVDFIKSKLASKQTESEKSRNPQSMREAKMFVIDQLVHLGFLAAAAYLLALNGINAVPSGFALTFCSILGVAQDDLVKWTVSILLVIEPASIVTRKIFKFFRPIESQLNGKDDMGLGGAGAYIGIIERLFILIFLLFAQYLAIGLVLTAKTLARYDRLSKEQTFAEYYLIGTLSSMLFATVVYFLIF